MLARKIVLISLIGWTLFFARTGFSKNPPIGQRIYDMQDPLKNMPVKILDEGLEFLKSLFTQRHKHHACFALFYRKLADKPCGKLKRLHVQFSNLFAGNLVGGFQCGNTL